MVTGRAHGIGKGTTQTLLAQGWKVAVLDQDAEAARGLSDEMPTDALVSIRADVVGERDVEKAFDKITDWTKAMKEMEGIDWLISNAGIANPASISASMLSCPGGLKLAPAPKQACAERWSVARSTWTGIQSTASTNHQASRRPFHFWCSKVRGSSLGSQSPSMAACLER